MHPRVVQATLLLERGRYLDAEAMLRAAIEEGVQSATVHAMLALCLRRAGVHEAANEEIKRALAIDPNCAYVHYVLSFLNAPIGGRGPAITFGTCIKHILHALELAPNEVAYLSRLAELRQALRQWKKSLEPIETALRLSPHNVGLAVQRAEALIHLGRRDEARETLLRALQSDPEAAASHAGMGWALLRAGERQRAAEFFDEALRLRPELDWAQHGALECAKHQYRLYRLLSYPGRRLIHRPGLRFCVETGASILLVFAALALLTWLDPIIRPRWGAWLVALIVLPLLFLPFAIQFGMEPLFAWLVRNHRAAQLSATQPIVKAFAFKWVLALITAGVTILFSFLLAQFKSPGVFGLVGLVPGITSLGLSLFDVPRGNARKWLIFFSAALLVAGPILLIAGRKFIIELDLDPRASMLLLVPAIIVFVIGNGIKQKRHAERHRQTVAASRKKFS